MSDGPSRKKRSKKPVNKPTRRGTPRRGGGPSSGPAAGRGERRDAGVRPGRRPPLRVFTTTLWEYPSQHYDDASGRTEQGSKSYEGATPSWVIWQVLKRYTREGDRVLDPMCGSGTTLDVCRDLGREGIGYDLAPTRDEIGRGDARELPMPDGSVRLVFLDPPYSTHIRYSDDPDCIGRLDAGEQPPREGEGQMGASYYQAMEEVIAEAERALAPGGVLAIYVSDSWRKRKRSGEPVFMPIGFELFAIARDYLEPIDIVCVARHNTKLRRGNWHKAAEEENFFLRGFNYLLLFRAPAP